MIYFSVHPNKVKAHHLYSGNIKDPSKAKGLYSPFNGNIHIFLPTIKTFYGVDFARGLSHVIGHESTHEVLHTEEGIMAFVKLDNIYKDFDIYDGMGI